MSVRARLNFCRINPQRRSPEPQALPRVSRDTRPEELQNREVLRHRRATAIAFRSAICHGNGVAALFGSGLWSGPLFRGWFLLVPRVPRDDQSTLSNGLFSSQRIKVLFFVLNFPTLPLSVPTSFILRWSRTQPFRVCSSRRLVARECAAIQARRITELKRMEATGRSVPVRPCRSARSPASTGHDPGPPPDPFNDRSPAHDSDSRYLRLLPRFGSRTGH